MDKIETLPNSFHMYLFNNKKCKQMEYQVNRIKDKNIVYKHTNAQLDYINIWSQPFNTCEIINTTKK